MRWYNEKRPHTSLNMDIIKTPHLALVRKTPGGGTVVTRNRLRNAMPRRARRGRTHFGIVFKIEVPCWSFGGVSDLRMREL